MNRTKEKSRILVTVEILDEAGEVIERSIEGEPIELVLGDGTFPPTVETALLGQPQGSTIEITCPEGEAFADPDPEAIVSVPVEDFPPEVTLEKGELVSIQVEDEDGEPEDLTAQILEVNPDGVILDANHPLAGKAATFRVEILELL